TRRPSPTSRRSSRSCARPALVSPPSDRVTPGSRSRLDRERGTAAAHLPQTLASRVSPERVRGRSPMRQPLVDPMLRAFALAVLAASWLSLASIAIAETARAIVRNASGEKVGDASFQDSADGVKVSATFTDLPPGQHAIHVHALGRCEPPFDSAGGHFNPGQRQHGRDNPQGAHAGDMPNLEVSDR